MFGFLIASLTGLARQMLVLAAFGTSAGLDAYFAALRLPALLFSLLAGGALGSPLVAPGFDDPGQIALTVQLLRIQLLAPILFGLSGLLMGVLNAHQHFLLPSLAPAMSNLGVILGVVFLVPRMGVYGLAWGYVLGAGLHLVIQLPGLRHRQARYHATLGLSDPSVRQVSRLMAPRLLSVGIVEINFLVNAIIASGLPTGSLTALTNAFTIMLMPQALIAQSTAISAWG